MGLKSLKRLKNRARSSETVWDRVEAWTQQQIWEGGERVSGLGATWECVCSKSMCVTQSSIISSLMSPWSPHEPIVILCIFIRSAGSSRLEVSSPSFSQGGPILSQPPCLTVNTTYCHTSHLWTAQNSSPAHHDANTCIAVSVSLSVYVYVCSPLSSPSQKLIAPSTFSWSNRRFSNHSCPLWGRRAVRVSSCHLFILLVSLRIFVHIPSLRLVHPCWSFCEPALGPGGIFPWSLCSSVSLSWCHRHTCSEY